MRSERKTYQAIRQQLLARASSLAVRVALRPRGWAPGLLAAGLIGTAAPALAQEIINVATDAELIIQGAAANDFSGISASGAGDVNGDGIDDLIVGAPGVDPNGRSNAGASYVVFGSDQGFPPIIDLATDADVTIQGAAANDVSGYSVSGAGDVNGDGIDDLIVGAPRADPNGRSYAGASYVVFGAADLAGTIDLADPASGADLIIQGAVAYDRSGSSVSEAGDINGDGIGDLIIGAYQADPNGRNYAGASYVVFGSDQGFPPILDLATDANVTIQGAAVYDRSGFSVSGAGDVNGDGLDDLIIGALQPGSAEQEPRYAGASYVVFGTDQGFPATIDLASDADLTMVGAATNDQFGRSVSGAGDVDGDGLDDLIIGAPNNSPNGREGAGASYVVFGGPAAAIERLIARVEAADLQPGIEKILTETLSRALDDLNKGKTSRAIIALRVFIGEVKALRGGKIDAADADEWIADARAIIDTLKAQRDQHREPSPMVEAQE
jgi:hypothetical protein